jgi:hypothetical protein
VVHVRQVLQALQDNGLVIHAEKCVCPHAAATH